MNTKSDNSRLLAFVGALAAVAIAVTVGSLAIRSSQVHDQELKEKAEAAKRAEQAAEADRARQQAEAEKAKSERKAALAAAREKAELQARENTKAAHAAELAKYLTGPVSRKPGTVSVAAAASSEDGTLNRRVTDALVRKLATNGVEFLPSLFSQDFLSDGLFASTFSGSHSPLARLDLLQSLDGVVLARENVEYSPNPSLDNTISAHMRLEITTMPLAANARGASWTLTATGIGFHRDEARSMAEDRLMKQIASDTNITMSRP